MRGYAAFLTLLMVLMMLAWDSRGSLEDFQRSKNYDMQHADLTKLSSTPVEIHQCDVDHNYWRYLTQNMGFIDAYFPASITDESKQIVECTPGLRYRMGSEKEAYRHRPVRGWLHGTRKYKGQDAVVVRFWNFWWSCKSERHFRVMDGITDTDQKYYLGMYDQFIGHLEKAGMMGMDEFHCSLERIWDYYRLPEDYPSDDEEHSDAETPVGEPLEGEEVEKVEK